MICVYFDDKHPLHNTPKDLRKTKVKKALFSLLPALAILFTGTQSVQAKKFHKRGHEVEILWKQKGSVMRVWGTVTDGEKSCKQMNYSIYFKNSETGSRAHVQGFIHNYRPSGRNNYKASDKISSTSHKKNWYVDDYYLDCLN